MKLHELVSGLLLVGACGASGDEVAPTAELAPYDAFHSHCGDHGGHDHALGKAIRRGADRLVDLQADTLGDNAHNGLVDADPDDGGWDWMVPAGATTHTTASSPENLYGGTALALWAAMESGNGHTRVLVGAIDAGSGMQQRPVVDSPPDFVFGVQLADLAENPGFADLARARYDARIAAAGGVTAFATEIRNARHASQSDALIPYDLGWLVLGTAALDAAFPTASYGNDADTYAKIVVDDLTAGTPLFDVDNPQQRFYVTGLAWALVSASWRHAHAPFNHVRSRLFAEQKSNGAWPADGTSPADDLQSTAHALQTLALTDDSHTAHNAAKHGASWLLHRQAPSGGWIDPGNTETPLVEGDILLGLVLSQTSVGDDGLVPDAQIATLGTARPIAAPLP